MKDSRQTAVLVYDTDRNLSGIFTTKDICLRVIAPNDLDPKNTSVVRVMVLMLLILDS
jgi:signal-transduction protein with cAMP-binding, CBS, and nucleotidyltransferase domain